MRIEKKGERERCKDRCDRNRNGYRWPGIVPSGCCTFVGDELLDLELCWLGGAGYENELNPMGAGVTALVWYAGGVAFDRIQSDMIYLAGGYH